jgi:hypothetical protein
VGDNPQLRAAHRRAADAGRRAAESAGVRPTKVSIQLEVYSGPIGAPGTFQQYSPVLVLDPRPKVTEGAIVVGYFGGGRGAEASGRLLAGQFLIGPITLEYPGGGYSLDQLTPAGSDSSRAIYILEGDNFKVGGEKFELVEVDASKPHQVSLIVERAKQ